MYTFGEIEGKQKSRGGERGGEGGNGKVREATTTTEGKLTSREQIASSMPATTCLFKLEFSHNGIVEVLLLSV